MLHIGQYTQTNTYRIACVGKLFYHILFVCYATMIYKDEIQLAVKYLWALI